MTTEIIWYGHAAIGIKTADLFILVDPYFNGNKMASEKPENLSPDYILVSHGHGDHLGDTISIAKRCGAKVICNSEISQWLSRQGIKTHGQNIGGGFQHPFGYLKFTPALHGSSLPDGSYGGNPCGFLLTTRDNKRIYLACDTGLFGDMALLSEDCLDLAMLPIGGNYTMGPEDALKAVKMLKPKMVVPIHYDTFDNIKQDAQQWAEHVASETDSIVRLLKPGDSLAF